MKNLRKTISAIWMTLGFPIGLGCVLHGGLGGATSATPMLTGLGLLLTSLVAMACYFVQEGSSEKQRQATAQSPS